MNSIGRTTALVLAVLVVGCSQKIDTYDEFRELAHRHEREGNLKDAVDAYRKALELDPEGALTWYDLGVAHVQQGTLEDAIAAYSRAIDLDPAMGPAFNNRAAVWAEQKRFDRAIEDFGHAIEIDPQDSLAWRNRGLAHLELRQFAEARADLDESIRINGREPSSYLFRGNVLLAEQQWARALEDFDSARHLDESVPEVWLSRARALAGLGRTDEARESAERAKSLGASIDDFDPVAHPAEPETIAAQPETSGDARAIVLDWLKAKNLVTEPAERPWDLRTTGDTPVHYLIRPAPGGTERISIQFHQEELDELAASPDIRTDLVIVEPIVVDGDSGDTAPHWRVVSVIDDWSPDFSKMQPQSWALFVDRPPAP